MTEIKIMELLLLFSEQRYKKVIMSLQNGGTL